ncbi:MAG: aminomethyl-transferring glycine dehydrogenase subunit GcvPA [Candidatus Omnitrophota bacterium]
MNYSPHTNEDKKNMFEAIGVKSVDELFKVIPEPLKPKSFNIPSGRSEFEVMEYLRGLAGKNNTSLVNFIGGGFYDHYIPAAIDALSIRSEFYTAYTPYQPECSQGWLQAIYEYQTVICELTGLDVSNASLYDGGTALYEAVMIAVRHTKRKKIILDSGVNPIYRTMLYTHTSNLDIELIETPAIHGQSSREDIYKVLDDKTAAVVLQNPNFFGGVDDFSDIVKEAQRVGSLAIASVYPISLGLLKTPSEMGFDIAVGEGQSLGIPLSFGGPYLGFIALKEKFMRQIPGRVVGVAEDKDKKRGFVLTLQAREQHIRRERATSNICSNESLCALRALIFTCLLGKKGIHDLAVMNYQKSDFAKSLFEKIPGVKVKRNTLTFNEFTIELPKDAEEVASLMIDKGFTCGLPLGKFYKDMQNYLLVAVTEKRTKQEIVNLVESLRLVLCS